MDNYTTVAQDVTEEVHIWAVPPRKYEVERARRNNEQLPGFTYRLYTTGSKPWEDGCVRVYSQLVTLRVPAGVDLVQAAVQTLIDAKQEVFAECQKKLYSLDQSITSLLQLTHQPETTNVSNLDDSFI